MLVYICFDDTDTLDAGRGTGKLARWFENELPEGCTLWGVVRQQLLVHEKIPYTSHNSSACAVIDTACRDILPELTTRAVRHIEKHFIDGSDPGLCIACEFCATACPVDAIDMLVAETPVQTSVEPG